MIKEIIKKMSEESKNRFLEQLLSKAESLNDESFDFAYQSSLKFSVDLGAKYLLARNQNETAVLLLENYQKYYDAANLCKKLGMKDRAVENFERVKEIKKAVEVYLGVDDYTLETSEVVIGVGQIDYMDELEKKEEKKEYSKAAEKALSLGMIKRAAKNLKLAGQEKEAEELLKNSNPVKAAQVWERNKKTDNAIAILYRNELYDKVAPTYERSGDFFSAGIRYYYGNKLEKALECYKKAGYTEGISRILNKLGKQEELVQHWEETNNSLALAEYYQDKDPEKAANFYEKIKDYKKVAECFVKAGKPIQGIQLLIDKCDFEEAVLLGDQLKEKDEQLTRLVNYCYKELATKNEKIQPTKALEYYEKAGDQEKVKELAAKLMKDQANLGNFKTALEYARKAENKEAQELYETALKFLN